MPQIKNMAAKKKPPSKDIKYLLNSCWSNVSLGHIHTWKEVLEYLGADIGLIAVDKLSEKPTYAEFKELSKKLTEKKVEVDVEAEILKAFESQFKDSLIESEYFHVEPEVVKLRKITIHELVQNSWPPDNPLQKCKLFYFQDEAAKWMYHKITSDGIRSLLLRVNTGDGKTFAIGRLIRALIDSGWTQGKTFSPYPFLYVTAASVIEQTKEVLRDKFGLDTKSGLVLVTNYDALRSSVGETWIEEEEQVDGGFAYTKIKWKPIIQPLCVIWDECQKLKNTGSYQSRVAQAFNDIPDDYPNAKHSIQIFSSATPFAKVESAKCFCVATRTKFDSYGLKRPLTNATWSQFAQQVAYPAAPNEFNKSAIKRLLEVTAPYVIGFRNVRRKHKGYTKAMIVPFETPEKQQQYALAWERYLEEKAKIEGDEGIQNKSFLILVQLQVFQQAAELIKADMIAEHMYQDVSSGRFATAGAFKFKPTIAKIVMILNEKYGVPRSKISLIWGGSSELDNNEKFSVEEIREVMIKAAMDQDYAERNSKKIKQIRKQARAANLGLGDIPKDLRLGIQDMKQRNEEKYRYQQGKSEYCLFTFGAGGAGLSLHHEYEYTKQRRGNFAVTWNEMDMAQATGRLPRLTSLSDTEQLIWAYHGTIELAVLRKLNLKTQCLTEVITQSDTIEISAKEDREAEMILKLGSGKEIEDEDDEDSEYGDAHKAFEEYEKDKPKEGDEPPTIDIK